MGHSGTPLPQKLGLAAGQRALLIDAPPDHPESWGELPDGFAFASTPSRAKTARYDLIVAFSTALEALAKDLPAWLARLDPDGMIWVVWPKKTPAKGSPKVESDITEDRVRDVALPLGLVDVKVCAVDGTWSGLKLVVRRELRAR